MPGNLSTGNESTLYSRLWIQPVLFVLTGAAAAYALMTAHSHYTKWQRKGRPTLRRRNAVRRNNRHPRNYSATAHGNSNEHEESIQALERQEQVGGVYGQWQVYIHGGNIITGGLIPRDVVMPQRIMELDISAEDTMEISQIIETAFIENFLIMEIPPGHYISVDEESFLVAHLSRRYLNSETVRSCIRRFNETVDFRQAVIAERATGLGTAVADIQVTTPFEYGSRYARTEDTAQPQQNQTSVPPAAPTIPSGPVPPLPHPTYSRESSLSRPLSQHQPTEQPLSPDDQASDFSFRDELEEDQPGREGQNLLNLLYHIADDQARKDGYIHRGVTCNSCNVMPIQGIRYRCANCIDYDLCETCEAMQVHNRTHLFYKIRVPAPFLGNPRQVQPVIYPGKPDNLPRTLSRTLTKRLLAESGLENSELEALWDQFRCLANTEWPEDPNRLGLAINRKTFDKCFVPSLSAGPPTPSLIYDRMFAYYDTNDDGLIGFEEFLKGLSSLTNQGRNERLKRTFDSYDLDRDGYIERKDLLRVFRAYYVLTRELTRETVTQLEDEYYEGSPRDVIMGAAPVSSAFPVTLDPADSGNRHVHGRTNEGKRMTLHGDMEIADGEGIFKPDEDLTRDRDVVIGNTAVRREYNTTRPMRRLRQLLHPNRGQQLDDDLSDDENDFSDDDSPSTVADFDSEYHNCELYPPFFDYHPPDWQIESCDIVEALGTYVPLSEITDPVDRARVGYATILRLDSKDIIGMDSTHRQRVQDRWERRQFYTDEEDGSRAPLGWNEDEDDSENDDSESVRLPPSPRSRSSSKVRFQDDVTDNEYDTYDTRSNASSRSIPVAERWGGFEIPEAERDVGKEVLYQVTQEGINELLNVLFKAKEDLMIEVTRTKTTRRRYATQINEFVDGLPEDSPLKVDGKTVVDNDDENSGKSHNLLALEQGNDSVRADGGFSDASSVSPKGITHGLPNGFTLPYHPASHSGSYPERSDSYRSESEPDPTLPQNRPNTADLQPNPPTPLSRLDNMWELSNERPRLTHQNAEGSLSAGRSLTPEQALVQVTSQTESSSTSDVPMTSFELYPSRVSYADHEDIIPQESSFSRILEQSVRSSPQSFNPHSFSSIIPPLEGGNSPLPQISTSVMTLLDTTREDEAPKSNAQLERLALLNQVEREAERRGGSVAKLTFEEFAGKMQRERQLDFLMNWIDVTSF